MIPGLCFSDNEENRRLKHPAAAVEPSQPHRRLAGARTAAPTGVGLVTPRFEMLEMLEQKLRFHLKVDANL